VLAVVFAVAAIGKLRDLAGSRQAMRDFGVPVRLAPVAGLLLPLAEILTALALVFSPSARVGALAAFLLLLTFIAGIAAALRRGYTPDCHCFGQIHSSPAGARTLIRNGILAALAAFVVVEGPGPAVDTWVSNRTGAELAAVGTGIAAVAFGLLALQLWLERRTMSRDLVRAQRQAAGAPPGIPVGSPAPEFSLPGLSGDSVTLATLRERGLPILLVFVSPSCGSCVELLPKLGRWQVTLAERLTLVLVSQGTAQQNQPIADEHGFDDILMQREYEVGEDYRIRATPSAVIVTPDGTVASNPAESVFGIEPMLRLALREGTTALAEGSVA
jgi:methylamine dehydrogenase accessory protein MauD